MLRPPECITIGSIGIGDMALRLGLDLQPGIIGGYGYDLTHLYFVFPLDAMGPFFIVIKVQVRKIIKIDAIFGLAVEIGGPGVEDGIAELNTPLIIHRSLWLKGRASIRRVQL